MTDTYPEEYSTLTCDSETEITASEEETVTVTGKELEAIVKKQIINSVTEFKTMDEKEIVDLFCDVQGLGEGLIPIQQFDFREYTAEYYRKKFPKFPENFYELMEKASLEKIANFTVDKKKEDAGMIRIEEETVVSFGDTTLPTDGAPLEESDAPSTMCDDASHQLDISDLSELDHMSLHPSGDLRPPALARNESQI